MGGQEQAGLPASCGTPLLGGITVERHDRVAADGDGDEQADAVVDAAAVARQAAHEPLRLSPPTPIMTLSALWRVPHDAALSAGRDDPPDLL